jgi:hypothetical protein
VPTRPSGRGMFLKVLNCWEINKFALTSPKSGGRSVGIVRLQTTATEFSFQKQEHLECVSGVWNPGDEGDAPLSIHCNILNKCSVSEERTCSLAMRVVKYFVEGGGNVSCFCTPIKITQPPRSLYCSGWNRY